MLTRDIRVFTVTLTLTIICLTWLAIPTGVLAQRHTVSGTITDAESGEVLIGANVYVVSLELGAATNAYGFYSLTIPEADSLALIVSYVGYHPQVKSLSLRDDITLDVQMERTVSLMNELTVTGQREEARAAIRQTRMSVVDVPVRMIEDLPAILGEQDVLKVIQLLPGIQAGQEGTTGIYVRGGNIDQNLVQLDEATVYNPNHLFGLFSTFNSSAINNVSVVKGGFPAQYGGRLSSVIEIAMRDGNKRHYEAEGGIGLLTSKLSIEGPITRDRGSFIVSARRSYVDLVAKPFQPSTNRNTYYFYDLNGKVNHAVSRRDRIFLSFFQGRDVAEYVDASGVGYGIRFGNSAATLRWNRIMSSRLFSNVSLIRNKYFLRISTVQGAFHSLNYSGIEDLTAKSEFQFIASPRHEIRFGAVLTHHEFSSTGAEGGVVKEFVVPAFDESNILPRPSTESALYLNDRWEISERVGLNVGVRVPHFAADGARYTRVEPRFSARLGITPAGAAKASYTVMHQFVHSVPSTTASLPTDIWIPSSEIVKPQRSEQIAAGYTHLLNDGALEGSLEFYYKWMHNQVLFKQGTQLLEYANIDEELTRGKGWSYGAELMLQKHRGRMAGWASYTLSWTNQRFPELNRGETFPFRYDRRHNLALTSSFDVNDRWTLAANFIFTSGTAFTLPTGRLYAAQGGDLYAGLFYDYDRLNNYRMRAYHRLDVSATRSFNPKWFRESSMIISVYNLYSRLNPYYVFLELDLNTGSPVGKQVSLLPVMPSVSFNFKI